MTCYVPLSSVLGDQLINAEFLTLSVTSSY